MKYKHAIGVLKDGISELKYDIKLNPEPKHKKTITIMKKYILELQQAIEVLSKDKE